MHDQIEPSRAGGATLAEPTPSPAPSVPKPANAYDAVPYSVHSFPQTQPDRLATVARLFGLESPPPDRCRVLELGCASGGNLIPMALATPDSQFVGVDLSQRQIDDGRAVVRELGLPNVDLRPLSITDVAGAGLGTFDYVLCHGVYSWVPPAVQQAVLDVCRRCLAPNGVAYVSYNTYPGWHARGAIREMLCYHTEPFDDPADRLREARALLGFLARTMTRQDGGFGALARQELAVLQRTPDTYLLHEHLEEVNEPLYFHQFAARAAAHGLQYLGEAQVGTMVASRLGPEVEETLRKISPDLLHMEQYMDFVRNRMFRQTLLCHAEVPLDHALRPEAVAGFRIASSARPVSETPDVRSGEPESFRAGEEGPTLTTKDPLMKAAMLHLAECWPRPVPFDELLAVARSRSGGEGGGESDDDDAAARRQLAARLLHCYTSSLAEFSLSPPAFVAHVSDRPVASPYARLRAARESRTTNLRLEAVELSEPARLVLQRLDGRHDRAALAAPVTDWIISHAPPPTPAGDASGNAPLPPPAERASRYVDELLQGLARGAILIA